MWSIYLCRPIFGTHLKGCWWFFCLLFWYLDFVVNEVKRDFKPCKYPNVCRSRVYAQRSWEVNGLSQLHLCSNAIKHHIAVWCVYVTLLKSLQIALSCRLPVDSPGPTCPLTAHGWPAPPVWTRLMQQTGSSRITESLTVMHNWRAPFIPAKSSSFALV